MVSIEKIYDIYKAHPVVTTDTRSITPGCIFFALKGPNFNGNTFAHQALENDASYVVIDEAGYKIDQRTILVTDVLKALQDLAKYHRKKLKIPFIGITGTNGKTTTKDLIHAVLSQQFKTLATKGNFNNHIGVPLTILSITPDIEVAIIEMGANHQKEIKMLSEIADPDCGMITNVGKAHLEGFGGFEGVKKGKKELYDHLHMKNRPIFINGNDRDLMEMAAAVEQKILYGTEGFFEANAEILASDPFLKIEFYVIGDPVKYTVQTHLAGDYNLNNVLAAITLGRYFEVPIKKIVKGLEEYEPVSNRSQILKTTHNSVIMDAYNANPSSMQAALQNFANMGASEKTVILGDMFELGAESEKEHNLIVMFVKSLKIKNAIFCGKDFMKSKTEGFQFFETTEEARTYLEKHPIKGNTILVKGSRGMKMEALTDAL